MYKILALSAHSNINKISKYLKSDIELVRGSFRLLEIFIGETPIVKHNNIPLEEYDFIWLNSTWSTRDIAFATMQYLEYKKIPYTEVEKATSKLTDSIICRLGGVNQPKTFFTHSKNIKESPKETFEKVKGYLKLPFIAKAVKGSLGTNIFLINNEKDFQDFAKNLKISKQFLIQEFVSNSYDWGINVANNKVVVASKRTRRNGFLNNIAQNAQETFIPIKNVPDTVKQCALLSAKKLGLSWIRADIIYNENTPEPLLLEINRRPGMTENSPEVKAFANFLKEEIEKSK